MVDLVGGMLRKDPNERLSIEQVLKHTWLSDPNNVLVNKRRA